MKTKPILAALAVISVMSAVPSQAQNACLQLYRLKTTQVIDNQTLKATDWTGKQFTIHMIAKCVGLDKFSQLLTFRPAAGIGDELLCLQHGDTVSYIQPGGAGRLQCTIDGVTAGPPLSPSSP
jgi:hypothetical protein